MNQAKKESVLLIECHSADARLITNALQNDVHEGLQVERIKKLSDGLDRIHQGRVRGVIVDIEMPNGKGVAAFERLRTTAPHVPILILSGVENEKHEVTAALTLQKLTPGKLGVMFHTKTPLKHPKQIMAASDRTLGWVLIILHCTIGPKKWFTSRLSAQM